MSLTNTQYESILREYYDIRAINREIAKKRRIEIEELSPEYEKITEEIGDISLKAAIDRISDKPAPDLSGPASGEDTAGADASGKKPNDSEAHDASAASPLEIKDDYKEKIRKLKNRQAEILASLGKPASYLDDIYTCEKCRDTGFIGTVKCECFRKREIELLYKESNLKNMAGNFTFEDFDLNLYSEADEDERTGRNAKDLAENALNAAKTFVEEFDKTKGNLFIYGNTGLGKTFLSTCIATALINTTHSVVYVTATEFFNKLNTFDEAVESSPILDCDLLIIDDLGTEYLSEISASKLFYCINERLLRGKSCVISTNLDLKSVRDHYSERLFSRIVSSYKVIKLCGRDLRTAKLFA